MPKELLKLYEEKAKEESSFKSEYVQVVALLKRYLGE